MSNLINRLQPLPFETPVVVTLNPARAPDPAKIIAAFAYDHPIFDGPAITAQQKLAAVQGKGGIWLAGAWAGYGFHEDGLQSALRGIGVWLIDPGFVATRLTAKNDFAMPALLTPEQTASEIVSGLRSGRFEIHFPKRFTRLMKLLAALPYAWSFPLIRRFTGAQ